MNNFAFKLDQNGLEAAENFWAAQHAAGKDYKFAVTKSGDLIAIAPESEFYNEAFAYRTPREAEQATSNRQPTRSLPGAIAGAIAAPRSQYHVVNPVAQNARGQVYPQGRAGDPVRAAQSDLVSAVARDAIGNAAHYGPGVAAMLPSVRRLPFKVLGPAATAVSLAGDVANTALDAQTGDALYSSTPENMLLTGGAAGVGAMLQKYFSKPEQIKRELDDLIRAKMGLGSQGKVDKKVRKEIYERGTKGLPMYTWDDWHNAPLREFDMKYGTELPMKYNPQPLLRSGKGAQILSRDAKPSAITKDIVIDWLNRKGINPQSVDLTEVQRILQNTYPRKSTSNLGMAMFPTKDTPKMSKTDWTKHKHAAASQEEANLWDEAVSLEDEALDKEWKAAKKAAGERKKKTDILHKSEGNRGKGGTSTLPIITQEQFDKLGKTGKYKRAAGRLTGLMLPIGAELFGRMMLPTNKE